MGSDTQERVNNGSGKAKQKSKRGAKMRSPIFTFNPSKEERALAKARLTQLGMVMDRIAGLVGSGVKLSVGYSGDRDAYFVIAREADVEWTEAAALSAWHKDLATCFAVLTVAVDGRFQGFPDCTIPAGVVEDDW